MRGAMPGTRVSPGLTDVHTRVALFFFHRPPIRFIADVVGLDWCWMMMLKMPCCHVALFGFFQYFVTRRLS